MYEQTVTITRDEYLRLQQSQSKCFYLEDRVQKLEKENHSLFRDTVRLNDDKKASNKEVVALRAELRQMANTITYFEDKFKDYKTRRHFGFYPKRPMEWKWRYGTDNPKMIPVDQYKRFKEQQHYSAQNTDKTDHSVNESGRYFNNDDH